MAERLARVQRLVEAARTLPSDAALRGRLQETTGLSAENVALGLERCLELHPAPVHLEALLASTPESKVAHVLLSGNVFVAALRAIAIGVVSSASLYVRPSRRDPALAEALHHLVPDLFDLVPKLLPRSGQRFWAYGSDETLHALREELPRGVHFHAHGSGFGAVVVNAGSFTEATARDVALDTVLFDQRGCLSPRVVCVAGSLEQARGVATLLASQLSLLADEIPPGPQAPEARAEARRQRDAAAYAFELFDGRDGWVSLSERFVLPPANRNLHVVASDAPVPLLAPFAAHLTNLATNDARLRADLSKTFPRARVVALGEMQRPPLDGPVDLRHGTDGELL